MEFFPLEMKKCVPLFLAFQILLMSSFSNQGLKSFIKIGNFIHHFAHHVICDKEKINIIEFVQLHYSNNEHNMADHSDHENLPFKSNDHDQQNISQQTPCLIPNFYTVGFKKIKIVSNSLILQSQQLLISIYSGEIWQPPKV